mgnify:FL=1|jgi:hypothetical protein
MTHYELLKSGESLLNIIRENGVTADDVRYLEVFENLERMEREGHKKTFIVAYLCSQYDISEATLYRVANRMRRAINAF